MMETTANTIRAMKLTPAKMNQPAESVAALSFPNWLGRRRRLRLVGGLSLLAVGLFGLMSWIGMGHKNLHYSTATIARGVVARGVIATGTVNPELTIMVGAYVSGTIRELYCDYNSKVKKGQVCARIDPRPYQTIVDQNKAALAVAKAQLEKDKAALAYSKVTYERYSRLVREDSASRDALDSATNTYRQAQAQIVFDEATIQQRQAALDAAQVNLDYTNITSPVDGTVVSRNVTMGQTVASSFQTPTLFLIASDLTRMQVDTNVSESDVGGIKPGDKATFTVDAYSKRIFLGTVAQARQSPQTVQNVVTYDIVVSVNNADLTLRPGMTAATHIIVEQHDDVLRVPNAALRYRPVGTVSDTAVEPTIWVLRAERARSISVSTGLRDENFTEIVSGDLKAGDQVITAETIPSGAKAAQPRMNF